jgi:hypothetical protein
MKGCLILKIIFSGSVEMHETESFCSYYEARKIFQKRMSGFLARPRLELLFYPLRNEDF